MSDPRLDALAQSARNRALKLVRSRVRTAGKQGFGKVGLTDVAGKPLFGMDGTAPSATPEEIDEFLRNLEAKDWDASVGAAESRSKTRRKPSEASAAPKAGRQGATAQSVPDKVAPPAPRLQIRDAKADDAARLAELINELGHPIDTSDVHKNLTFLIKAEEAPLVATLNGDIVGLCGVSKRIVITRPAPLGRITSLIVTKQAQGKGAGRMLVEAAEAWMRKRGCQLVEVTSNDRRSEAHAFYRHMGYERTSIRFAKML